MNRPQFYTRRGGLRVLSFTEAVAEIRAERQVGIAFADEHGEGFYPANSGLPTVTLYPLTDAKDAVIGVEVGFSSGTAFSSADTEQLAAILSRVTALQMEFGA